MCQHVPPVTWMESLTYIIGGTHDTERVKNPRDRGEVRAYANECVYCWAISIRRLRYSKDINYGRVSTSGVSWKEGVGTTNDNTSPCTSSVYLYSAHPAAVFTAIDPLRNARRVLKPLHVGAKAGAGDRRKKKRGKSKTSFFICVYRAREGRRATVVSYRKKFDLVQATELRFGLQTNGFKLGFAGEKTFFPPSRACID